jgi:hypothetical protein
MRSKNTLECLIRKREEARIMTAPPAPQYIVILSMHTAGNSSNFQNKLHNFMPDWMLKENYKKAHTTCTFRRSMSHPSSGSKNKPRKKPQRKRSQREPCLLPALKDKTVRTIANTFIRTGPLMEKNESNQNTEWSLETGRIRRQT